MLTRILTTTALSLALMTAAYAGPDTVVAKVGKLELKLSEMAKMEKATPPQILEKMKKEDPKKVFEMLRDQWVMVTLMTDAAKNSGIENDPEVKKAIEGAIENIKIQAYIAKMLQADLADDKLKARYDEVIKSFPKDAKETKARHILVKDEATAQKIIDDLKSGADFAKIAREQSLDKASGKEGGDVGYFGANTQKRMVPEFETAALALEPGKFSDKPVKTQFGYHVIKVDDRRTAKVPKFDEVKDEIGMEMMQTNMMKLVAKLRAEKKDSIQLFDQNGKPEKAAEKTEAAPKA